MKKILNLDFVEIEHLESDTDVCLMPCPCSNSYSYSTTYQGATYQGTGGSGCFMDVVGQIFGGPTSLNEGEDATIACHNAIAAFCQDNDISADDCKGLQDAACNATDGANGTGGAGGK